MSGRDFGRGGRGGFGDRYEPRNGGDRDRPPGGGFRDRDGGPGGFRDRDRGGRSFGPPPSRPWERRDDDRPPRPAGDRPFDRPAEPAPDREVRVERYYDEPGRPRREERSFDDRPRRFGDDRPGRFGDAPPRRDAPPAAPGARPPVTPPAPVPAPAPAPPLGRVEDMIAVFHAGPRIWTPHHLIESWHDEERQRGANPTDQELQESVEDNIEADRLVPGRDRRRIMIKVQGGIVTLSGIVRNRMVKFAAYSDAFWTYGVKDVRNEMAIKGQEPPATAASVATEQPAAPATPVTRAAAAQAEPPSAPPPVELEAEDDDFIEDTGETDEADETEG